MPNTIKTLVFCTSFLILQACGGSSDSISEDPSPNDGLSQEEVSFFKSVVTGLYQDNNKNTAYVDELISIVDQGENQTPLTLSDDIDVIGIMYIDEVGNSAQDTAIGVLDLSILISQGTFAGSAYDFVQVNSATETEVDSFSGQLDIFGSADANGVAGRAIGTLTDTTNDSIDLDFGMQGVFVKSDQNSPSVVGEIYEDNYELTGGFIAVEY